MPILTGSRDRIVIVTFSKAVWHLIKVLAVHLLSLTHGCLLSAVGNSSLTEFKTDTAGHLLIQRNANWLSAEIRPAFDYSGVTVYKTLKHSKLTSPCAKWKAVSMNSITKLSVSPLSKDRNVFYSSLNSWSLSKRSYITMRNNHLFSNRWFTMPKPVPMTLWVLHL